MYITFNFNILYILILLFILYYFISKQDLKTGSIYNTMPTERFRLAFLKQAFRRYHSDITPFSPES